MTKMNKNTQIQLPKKFSFKKIFAGEKYHSEEKFSRKSLTRRSIVRTSDTPAALS